MSAAPNLARGRAAQTPLSALLLGLCPALAVSTRVSTALWMALAILGVATLSTLLSVLLGLAVRGRESRLRGFLPLILAAAATAAVQILFDAFAPAAGASLGLYLPVLSVNCLVICRAELAARGEPPGEALRGSLAASAGLGGCIVAIAAVREILGFGTLSLVPIGGFDGTLVIRPLAAAPVQAIGLAFGGFLAAGYLAALAAALARIGRRDGDR